MQFPDRFLAAGLACTLASATWGPPPWAQTSPPCEISKVLAQAGGPGDRFGCALDLDGFLAVVGADQTGTLPAPGSGYAVILDGSTGVWLESDNLIASDGASGDRFASAIAMDGALIVVGAPGDDDGGQDSGSAYVFQLGLPGTTGWTQMAKLVASDAATGHTFGTSVAIEGTIVLVGAPGGEAAYAFDLGPAGWTQTSRFVPPGGPAMTAFGTAVAVSGTTAMVGAPRTRGIGGGDSGSVHVYDRPAPAAPWAFTSSLIPIDTGYGDLFGTSIDLEGPGAIIGAPRADSCGTAFPGATYAFDLGPAGWFQRRKLKSLVDCNEDHGFGSTAVRVGNLVIATAPLTDSRGVDAGGIWFFRDPGNGWIFEGKRMATDSEAGDAFGTSIALSGDTFLVGTPGDDDLGSNSGSITIWSLAGLGCPLLFAEPQSISLAQGGTQHMTAIAGSNHAGAFYFVGGTASGTGPGIPLGSITVPLNPDAYLQLTVRSPNQPPLGSSFGILGSLGQGPDISLTVPPLTDPSLAGLTLHHAYVLIDPVTGTFPLASNAEPLVLLP